MRYHIAGVGAGGTGFNIFDQNRTRRRPVALPQFHTVHAVIGPEEQGVAHHRQPTRGARETEEDILN